MPAPIYTAESCRFAYQLNWSLSIFSHRTLPDASEWLPQLQSATEPDGVRVLEHRVKDNTIHQFLLSTQPHVSPSQAICSVKGRYQYLIRAQMPQAFSRNYHLHSVGSAKREAVQQYISSQTAHHRMADERVQKRLDELQFHNPAIDLSSIRRSAHGQFVYNLHLVFVHRDRLSDIRTNYLEDIHTMLKRASTHHKHLLADAGILSDHIHLAIGCNVDESPQQVALSYLNNLAYTQEMKAAYQHGAYLGTFGEYDLGAIRQSL
jgi:REP element-mobilizing transposase RayT